MQWWLTFHLLGIVLWTGGLLTISRMAAYHVTEIRPVQDRFAWVEGRMYWLVTVPGTVITLVTAAGLLATSPVSYGVQGWFMGKMVLVILLGTLQGLLYVRLNILREHPEQARKKFFSALHGCIGLTVIALLIMVTVRPF